MRDVVGWGLFSVLLITITWLSLVGNDRLPGQGLFNIPYFDKAAHFGVYFILSAVGTWASYQRSGRAGRKYRIGLVIGVIGYGIILETLQWRFIENRFFEFFDIIANSAGAFGGWLALEEFLKTRNYGS